jgi:hypothetical protein
MIPPLPRRLLAEGLGSALLFATVIGSGIMAERLSLVNDAVALLDLRADLGRALQPGGNAGRGVAS